MINTKQINLIREYKNNQTNVAFSARLMHKGKPTGVGCLLTLQKLQKVRDFVETETIESSIPKDVGHAYKKIIKNMIKQFEKQSKKRLNELGFYIK